MDTCSLEHILANHLSTACLSLLMQVIQPKLHLLGGTKHLPHQINKLLQGVGTIANNPSSSSNLLLGVLLSQQITPVTITVSQLLITILRGLMVSLITHSHPLGNSKAIIRMAMVQVIKHQLNQAIINYNQIHRQDMTSNKVTVQHPPTAPW